MRWREAHNYSERELTNRREEMACNLGERIHYYRGCDWMCGSTVVGLVANEVGSQECAKLAGRFSVEKGKAEDLAWRRGEAVGEPLLGSDFGSCEATNDLERGRKSEGNWGGLERNPANS